jgi:hypothetical protein
VRRLARWLAAAGVLCAGASAPAFTQRTLVTSLGHEAIIVAAASAIQAGPRVDASTIGCPHCDRYGTDDWHVWSAVIGNRWADMGGYDVLHEIARPLLGKDDCFDAVVQDAQSVQYQHGLRTWADVGEDGARRTQDGTRTVIWDRFYRGWRETETAMWVRDGGLRVHVVRVDRAYFFLGMALHALQDSFSTEHTQRSTDWTYLVDYKTYVGTPGAQQHAQRGKDKDKFTFFGIFPQPTPKNGDYVFVGTTSDAWTVGNVKDSAAEARDASFDLMTAFEAARRRPGDVATLVQQWSAWEAKWLRGPGPAPGAPQAPANPLPADLQKTEDARNRCLEASGRGSELTDYPPFCWPAGGRGPCTADAQQLEGYAAAEATRSLDAVKADVQAAFAAVPARVEDPPDGSAATLGSRAGDETRAAALQEADRFFLELGDSFATLSEPRRRHVVDDPWDALVKAMTDRAGGTRDAACARVRRWPGTDAARQAAESQCRAAFDARWRQRRGSLDALYDAGLRLDLVAVAPLPSPAASASAASAASSAAAPPATADAQRRALYEQMQACIDDPMRRVLNPLGHESTCRDTYREGLRGAGL